MASVTLLLLLLLLLLLGLGDYCTEQGRRVRVAVPVFLGRALPSSRYHAYLGPPMSTDHPTLTLHAKEH